jgi:hypothetical protein
MQDVQVSLASSATENRQDAHAGEHTSVPCQAGPLSTGKWRSFDSNTGQNKQPHTGSACIGSSSEKRRMDRPDWACGTLKRGRVDRLSARDPPIRETAQLNVGHLTAPARYALPLQMRGFLCALTTSMQTAIAGTCWSLFECKAHSAGTARRTEWRLFPHSWASFDQGFCS